jgi:hypothetical protein
MITISMDTNIYGMAVRGRTIYYCTEDKGIKMLNLSDKYVSDIINSNMSSVYFCHSQVHVGLPDHPWKTIVVYDVVHQGR